MKLNDRLYRELRCNGCRKLICQEYIFAGRILFICPRCGEVNEFTFKHLKTKDNTDKLNQYQISPKVGE